jgi:hypothetical protein
MPTVKLQRYKDTDNIVAPDFCPYARRGLTGDPVMKYVEGSGERALPGLQVDMVTPLVHPSLCAICKFCTFVNDVVAPEELVSAKDREAFADYLTHVNMKVGSSILAQRQYLTKTDRLLLVILLSAELLQEMLDVLVFDLNRKHQLFSYFLNEEVPVCSVLGCPVYVSRKLTKSQVQVVGEVEWR